jgi:membrane associated rhomboid family serine protease
MSVTLILIIITVGISIYAWSNQELFEKLKFHPYSVRKKHEYYRFITSGFIHADWAHLLFNMFSFYSFGQVIEYVFSGLYGPRTGPLLFLLLYIIGIIAADIYTFIKENQNYGYRSLGASGGVSAIIFSSILLNPLSKIIIFPIPVGIPGFIFGGLYLLYSHYQAKRMEGNVSHDSHFYGAVFGLLATIFLVPNALENFILQIQQW